MGLTLASKHFSQSCMKCWVVGGDLRTEMTRATISYPDELSDRIERLEDLGVVEGPSDFFQRSGAMYLGLLELTVASFEDADAEELTEIIETLEDNQELLIT